jgi:uncharacterized protein (DUF697 family)
MPKSTRSETTVEEVVPVLSSEQRLAAAEKIVRKNVYCAAGIGCVPVPLIDLVGIGAFQAVMIKQLSAVYGVKFNEHLVRNTVTALVGTIGTRAITAGVVGSIFKILPGIGGIIGGLLAVPAIAGGVTYGIGKVFIKHFEEGGTILDLDVEKTKTFFQSQYKVGTKVATTPATA